MKTTSFLLLSETCRNDHKFQKQITSTRPLLEQVNAMTMYEMNTFQTLCFMYICKNGNTPSIFKHIYTLN